MSLPSLSLASSHSPLRPEHMAASRLSRAFLSVSMALGRGSREREEGRMEKGRNRGRREGERRGRRKGREIVE